MRWRRSRWAVRWEPAARAYRAYRKRRREQVTIRMRGDVISHVTSLSDETGIPYQNLINLYLPECVEKRKKPTLEWVP